MTVHRVIVQIRAPSPLDPGQVSEGFYVVEGGVLIMTRPDGSPVDPDRFRHALKDGDSPAAIAGVLTKLVRKSLAGMSEDEERFGRRLSYQPAGIC